jgi:hypothetical protein
MQFAQWKEKKGNMEPVSRGKDAVQFVWKVALPRTGNEAVEK